MSIIVLVPHNGLMVWPDEQSQLQINLQPPLRFPNAAALGLPRADPRGAAVRGLPLGRGVGPQQLDAGLHHEGQGVVAAHYGAACVRNGGVREVPPPGFQQADNFFPDSGAKSKFQQPLKNAGKLQGSLRLVNSKAKQPQAIKLQAINRSCLQLRSCFQILFLRC